MVIILKTMKIVINNYNFYDNLKRKPKIIEIEFSENFPKAYQLLH